mmetsp:Transcript_101628/g.282812  ORF Transcript_101628/g.282812 Transcript_101628/m.282812 type:complete len:219 (+) Transcript_101628:462-1118(+)
MAWRRRWPRRCRQPPPLPQRCCQWRGTATPQPSLLLQLLEGRTVCQRQGQQWLLLLLPRVPAPMAGLQPFQGSRLTAPRAFVPPLHDAVPTLPAGPFPRPPFSSRPPLCPFCGPSPLGASSCAPPVRVRAPPLPLPHARAANGASCATPLPPGASVPPPLACASRMPPQPCASLQLGPQAAAVPPFAAPAPPFLSSCAPTPPFLSFHTHPCSIALPSP